MRHSHFMQVQRDSARPSLQYFLQMYFWEFLRHGAFSAICAVKWLVLRHGGRCAMAFSNYFIGDSDLRQGQLESFTG